MSRWNDEGYGAYSGNHWVDPDPDADTSAPSVYRRPAELAAEDATDPFLPQPAAVRPANRDDRWVVLCRGVEVVSPGYPHNCRRPPEGWVCVGSYGEGLFPAPIMVPPALADAGRLAGLARLFAGNSPVQGANRPESEEELAAAIAWMAVVFAGYWYDRGAVRRWSWHPPTGDVTPATRVEIAGVWGVDRGQEIDPLPTRLVDLRWGRMGEEGREDCPRNADGATPDRCLWPEIGQLAAMGLAIYRGRVYSTPGAPTPAMRGGRWTVG